MVRIEEGDLVMYTYDMGLTMIYGVTLSIGTLGIVEAVSPVRLAIRLFNKGEYMSAVDSFRLLKKKDRVTLVDKALYG